MKIFFVAILAIFSMAANAQNLKVRAIYERAAFSSQTLLPFIISDANGAKVKILSVVMGDHRGACGMVIDRFRPEIFLAKCASPVAQLDFVIVVEVNGSVFQTHYGPIQIQNPYANMKILDSGAPISDPDILLGQQLFASHCITCHLSSRPGADTSVAKIKLAMKSVPRMINTTSLKSLTDAQLMAIVKFLGSTK